MATKIKYTEKELKQPDEFNKTVMRIIDFTADHAKKILIAVGLVIIILIAAFILNSGSEKERIEANNMFDSAMELYNNGDNQGALSGFLETEKAFPDQGVSNIALYYAAIISFNEGNYSETVSLLNRFEKSEIDEPLLVESATLTQGLAYFNQNEWQNAIDYFSNITDPASPFEKEAKLYSAISYEKLGDTARAKEIYNQITQTQGGMNPGITPVAQPQNN